MRDFSVFCDEAGDFGGYEHHSPYYIVTFVFHDQSVDIQKNIEHLVTSMRHAGMPDYTVHAGPIIRREKEYEHLPLLDRKRIFNFLYNFVRTSDITYHSIVVEKKHLVSDVDLIAKIAKQLAAFLKAHQDKFSQYDRVVLYYDYGQMELTHILVATFTTLLQNVEFRKVAPANYKLFQAADMLCTLELLSLKAEKKMLSNSELKFFTSVKILQKSYLKSVQRKKFK